MKSSSNDGFPRPYGKYELLARIGQGGMAEVFRARLPGVAGFEKIVVIKRLLPHLTKNAVITEMFVNEAKLAAAVHHRNIVQVFELGELDGEYYMAMEHVAGTDLRQLLRAAAVNSLRVPPWFGVQVVAEVLDGLAFAHALVDEHGRMRNVVHRDVTPANIFISYMGDVKLGDFGVAKDESRSSQTRAGQMKGKVPYMSPEQIYGRELDHRTDVFAAGVVLWECLTQRRLFGGRPDIESMNLICYGDRKPPSAFASDVPEALDRIVMRALAADVEQRTSSARELHAELLDVLPLLRPRVHQNDVKNIVEVVLGNRDPSVNTGPKPIHDESVVRQNFLESTPGVGSGASKSGVRAPLIDAELVDSGDLDIEVEDPSKSGDGVGYVPPKPLPVAHSPARSSAPAGWDGQAQPPSPWEPPPVP
ncbi:serine/threonine protein kinase, partial [Myxococcota bacterium]|nr:serine/threonine protein kinase [Myxococcota bacterium]